MRRKSLKVAVLVAMAGTMLQFGGCLGGAGKLFWTGLVAGAGFNLADDVVGVLGLADLLNPPATTGG